MTEPTQTPDTEAPRATTPDAGAPGTESSGRATSEPETLKIGSRQTATEVILLPADEPQDMSRFWWFFLVMALGLVGFGLILFAWPRETMLVLSVVVGTALVFFGVMEIASSILQRNLPLWGWFLFRGVATLGLGVLLLAWPGRTILVLAVVFGIYLIFTGLMEVMLTIALPDAENRWLYLLLGILGIVLGVVVLSEIRSEPILGMFFGTFVVFFGALEFISALTLRVGPDDLES